MDGLIHINWANINFSCPHCGNAYADQEDKYLDRVNRNKCQYTRITCNKCEEQFGMTYDIQGDAVGFSLKKDGRRSNNNTLPRRN